jgi:hypothetical protein
LKARICKTLCIDDFFTFNLGKKELYKPYKVHDFQDLIILSGIYPELLIAQEDFTFKSHWSVVCEWAEGCRYVLGKNEKMVSTFIISIKAIGQWIKEKL